jgi:DegV family protein with EDD domain
VAPVTVKIVTESTADIPPFLAEELGIRVVPTLVTFGTDTYRDGVDLTKEQFYNRLKHSTATPTTAAPSPDAYAQVYRELAHGTDEIVSIHTASKLSALYSTASLAATGVAGARIAVLDSEQVTMGCGLMAVAAAEAAQRGATLEQIVGLVESMKARTWVIAALAGLDFVYRGGRLARMPAMIGTLLHIKPIIIVRAGEAHVVERMRSWRRALERLVEMVAGLGPLERAIVLDADAPVAAGQIADKVKALRPDWRRLTGQAGVTIASHAGPGAVGVAVTTAA